jgi:tRNA G18 (ribose-2'-O)-methylase SpoU
MNINPATPEVFSHYSKLKESGIGTDYFIADSARVVLKLLETEIKIHSLLATQEWIKLHEKQLEHIPHVYFASIAEMQSIVGYSLHQGVMALAHRPKDVSLEDLTDNTIVVLDGIAKADNVGAIIRNAAAFGFKNILIDSKTVHPFHRRAVRTSMGNVYGLKIHQTNDLAASLTKLQHLGFKIYGFENRPQASLLHETEFAAKTAFIIGSEAIGIAPEVLPAINQLIRIPINQDVYALNAACASAVAMYEVSLKLKKN